MAQTDRQLTQGHGDSMTELAKWGQFSENEKIIVVAIFCAKA